MLSRSHLLDVFVFSGAEFFAFLIPLTATTTSSAAS
jgi:hypothetical protein